MSDVKLGQLITNLQHRDAIHVAVAPAVAGELLKPAQRVCLVEGKAVGEVRENAIGIVDPFLRTEVAKGQGFWICLFPGTIKALRHVWVHPDFQDEGESNDAGSRMVLESLAQRCGCSYERLMDRLDVYAEGSCGPDDDIQETLNALGDELAVQTLWASYESVRGIKVDSTIKSDTYFRCAC